MMSKFAFQPSLLAAVASVVLAATGITPAHAQSAPPPSDVPEDPYDDSEDLAAPDPQQQAEADDAPAPAPATQPPNVQPPPPPSSPPAVQQQALPPQQQVAPQQQAGGQWVYTQQYGWLWMPYGNQYVYTPEDTGGAAYPSEYVYYPAYGWTWITAPWVWGWGPQLYFSFGRPHYFGWYHHPHFIGRGFVGRGFVRGFHAPVRGGFVRGYRPVYRGGFRGGPGHVSGGFRGFGGHVGGRVSGGSHFGGHVGGHVSGGSHFGGHGRH